ncbi:MAG TPA: hypothetical protein PLD10_16260 [Rhodopila sp.]|nr:hypothetical protein [Rhodopila sp.]
MSYFSGYDRCMQAQNECRYQEHLLKIKNEELHRSIGLVDCSDLIASIVRIEQNIANLRSVKITDDPKEPLPIKWS